LVAQDKFDLSVYDERGLAVMRYDTAQSKALTGPLWGFTQLLNPGQSTLYWNADVFKAKGVALPAENASMDDLVNIGKQLTQDKDGDGKTDVWGFLLTTGFGHGIANDTSLIASFGGEVISRDGKTAMLNTPQSVQGFQWYYDLIWSSKIQAPKDVIQALGSYKEMHMKGQLGMFKNGPWGGMHFRLIPPLGQEGHVEAGGIPFPKGPSGRNGAIVGGEPWAITKATKYPMEAFQVLKWTNDKESAKYRALGTLIPPLHKEAQKDPEIQADALIAMNIRAAANADLPYLAANGRDAEINRLLTQEMAAIDTNATQPTQAFFDGLAKKVQEILDKPKA
jgi:ABC-type glycerol-3-phosphate transport system substrate-binding protein